MNKNDLKRLSRGDLLEMLVAQGEELEAVKAKLVETEEKLQKKEMDITEAGSIAEASMKLNGVFEAAQAACEQYTENIKLLSDRQRQICDQLEQESREKAEALLAETNEKCETMEKETEARCNEMLANAEKESKAYWTNISQKLDVILNERNGLRELLSAVDTK